MSVRGFRSLCRDVARRGGVTLAVGLTLAGCGRGGCAPDPASRGHLEVVGSAVGKARRVTLWQPERDVRAEARMDGEGRFAIPSLAPEAIDGARVVFEAEGGATTTTGKLSLAAIGSGARVTIAPLAAWSAPVDVKREGARLRFAWPPLDVAGRPSSVRYSLIFSYEARRGGEPSLMDATLITRECEAVQTVEQLSEILPDRDAASRTIEVRVRAYDPGDANGLTWAGPPLRWTVPDDLGASAGEGAR